MSKASDYAKVRMPQYHEGGNNTGPSANVNGDGNLAVHGTFSDPLALARWIVETWGEDDERTVSVEELADAAYDKAKQRCIHVSPTGEITGTLPCGHGVDKIRTQTAERDGHRPIVGARCRECCAAAIRSPAP